MSGSEDMIKKTLKNYQGNQILENVLSCTMVLLLFSMLLSQFFLVREETRTSFTNIENYEGKAIEHLAAAMQYGEIELSMVDARPSSKVKILVNGEAVSDFREGTVKLPVLENSLIEIDGSGYNGSFTVLFNAASDNINTSDINPKLLVNKNIEILGRILFK